MVQGGFDRLTPRNLPLSLMCYHAKLDDSAALSPQVKLSIQKICPFRGPFRWWHKI